MAGRDLISIITSANEILAGEGCDMSSCGRGEERASQHAYGDLADEDILYPTGQMAKKAGLHQIPGLQSLGWKRFNDLGKAVDSIVLPVVSAE